MTNTKNGAIRVFVYGTLKRDHYNHYLLEGTNTSGTTFLGRCKLVGPWRMLDLRNFPGVQYDPLHVKDQVPIYGEVYEITPETMAALDLLEGNGNFFTRQKIRTPFKNAWVYCIPANDDFRNRYAHIPEGVWRPTADEQAFITRGVDMENYLQQVVDISA